MSVVDKVYRNYGGFVLDFQKWEIPDTGITALWGPSGSGKTSLVRCLLGLDSEADFKWRFAGESLETLSLRQRNLSVVFQDLCLFPHMSVRSNILFPVKKGQDYSALFEQLVSTMKLEPLLSRGVKDLSGGEQQRVAIARALIYQPRLIFMDEPFSSLDQGVRGATRAMVSQIIESLKIPMILITHDPEDVAAMAQKVTSIAQGKNQGDQSIAQFRSS